MVEDKREREPDCCLCESFTKAYTFTAHERRKSKWVPWLAISRLQPNVVLILCVEAFRLELFWLNPLSRVVLNRLERNGDCCPLLNPDTFVTFPDFCVLSHALLYGVCGRWLYPENFTVALLKIFVFHYGVIRKILDNIVSNFFEWW